MCLFCSWNEEEEEEEGYFCWPGGHRVSSMDSSSSLAAPEKLKLGECMVERTV